MAKKDKGRWITTDEGHHIHLGEDGKPDRGNKYVIAAMTGGEAKYEDDTGTSYTHMTADSELYDLSDEDAADLEEELGGSVYFGRDEKGNITIDAENNHAMEEAYIRMNAIGDMSFAEAYGSSIGEKFATDRDARKDFQKNAFSMNGGSVGASRHAEMKARFGEGDSGTSFTKISLYKDTFDIDDATAASLSKEFGVKMQKRSTGKFAGRMWDVTAKRNSDLERLYGRIAGGGTIHDAMNSDTHHDFASIRSARRYFRKHYFSRKK